MCKIAKASYQPLSKPLGSVQIIIIIIIIITCHADGRAMVACTISHQMTRMLISKDVSISMKVRQFGMRTVLRREQNERIHQPQNKIARFPFSLALEFISITMRFNDLLMTSCMPMARKSLCLFT